VRRARITLHCFGAVFLIPCLEGAVARSILEARYNSVPSSTASDRGLGQPKNCAHGLHRSYVYTILMTWHDRVPQVWSVYILTDNLSPLIWSDCE